jgi:aminoglycoside 6'-N-acetyltransferase
MNHAALVPPPDPFPLETPRLRVRRLRAGDLAAFQAYRHDSEVGRWQGWTPQDDAAAAAFLASMADGPWHRPGAWCQFALADRATDALLGDLGVGFPLAADSPLEIGFSLAAAAQGRGLAHEAVAATLAALLPAGIARGAEAITDTRNTASVQLLERLGFVRIATLTSTFRDAPCEEHHYLLASAAALLTAPASTSPPPASPTADPR